MNGRWGRTLHLRGSGERSRRVLVAAALLVATACTAEAQRLVDAEMRIVVDADAGRSRVRLRYRVDAATERMLPLELIRFSGVIVDSLAATVDGVVADVEAVDPDAPMHHAAVPLGTGPASRVIELSYRVRDTGFADGSGRVRVPVLATTWPPAAALPGTFRVAVALPAGHSAWNAFPSTLRGSDSISAQLSVLSSMIAFDTGPGGRPLLTFANLLDALIVLSLALFGMIGWRRFRSAR